MGSGSVGLDMGPKNSGEGTPGPAAAFGEWHGECSRQEREPRPSRWWPGKAERTEMICDYNGWNDAPEEEREWFDQHPEIWGGLPRDADSRPLRVTPAPRIRHLRRS